MTGGGYREELERMAHEYRLGDRDLDAVLHEAYFLGIKAHGDVIQSQAPEVYRLANEDGKLIARPGWSSSVKRFYETVTGARRARQFGPEGCKVQAGRVQWEDV